LRAAFKDRDIGSGDAIVLCDFRLTLGVDELDGQLGTGLPITVEAFLVRLVPWVLLPREHCDADIPREVAKDTIGFRRERIVLILGEVPADRMSRREEVDDGEDAEKQRHHEHTVGAHAGRSLGGKGLEPFEVDGKGPNERDQGQPFQ